MKKGLLSSVTAFTSVATDADYEPSFEAGQTVYLKAGLYSHSEGTHSMRQGVPAGTAFKVIGTDKIIFECLDDVANLKGAQRSITPCDLTAVRPTEDEIALDNAMRAEVTLSKTTPFRYLVGKVDIDFEAGQTVYLRAGLYSHTEGTHSMRQGVPAGTSFKVVTPQSDQSQLVVELLEDVNDLKKGIQRAITGFDLSAYKPLAVELEWERLIISALAERKNTQYLTPTALEHLALR